MKTLPDDSPWPSRQKAGLGLVVKVKVTKVNTYEWNGMEWNRLAGIGIGRKTTRILTQFEASIWTKHNT